jgi:predicted nucleic acid-binding protein
MVTEFRKIFLDTAPLIYFLDEDVYFGKMTQDILFYFLQNNLDMITSTITCTEYLTYPYRTGNVEKINAFFDFLGDCEIPMHSISVEVAKKAAEIRGRYPHFKTMDCLQLAVACIYSCDMFLTNDNQLRQFKEVRCITVEELKKPFRELDL